MNKKYPVVEVTWLDHTSVDGWLGENGLKESNLLVCYSIGYRVAADKRCIKLAGALCHPPGLPFSNVQVIARKLILKQRIVNPTRKGVRAKHE